MEVQDYLGEFANQLVTNLTPILSIKGVTSNTDLLGEYTEAAIRNLVHSIVRPMRVCTGAVLDYPPLPSLRQIDLIIGLHFLLQPSSKSKVLGLCQEAVPLV